MHTLTGNDAATLTPSVRQQRASEGELSKADTWRRDGTEFLMAEVWLRFWNVARDAAGLPEDFTPYNARHTGISWAIDKGVDLQKVRQRAGHGSLEVTSRYAAILDERDTSLADALEEILTIRVLRSAPTRVRQSRPRFPEECRCGHTPWNGTCRAVSGNQFRPEQDAHSHRYGRGIRRQGGRRWPHPAA